MRGSKAKDFRKVTQQVYNLDPKQAIYNDWSNPEFAELPNHGGFVKVVKGVPCELTKQCGRAVYKKHKKDYKEYMKNG